MGTKVQCKTFLPIYSSMREHNSETSSGWPLFYEDLPRSVQFLDSSTSMCIDGFLEYDKFVLKQTMLKHEAIFRTQVLELHRLYGRQREMMDELKRQAQCSSALEARTSQSSATSLSLQVDAANVVDRSSEISASTIRPSISTINDPLHFSEGINGTEFQTRSEPKATNLLDIGERPSQKIEKTPKILIDLQLPADAYTETEDTLQCDIEIGGRALFHPSSISANGDIDLRHELNCNTGCLGKGEFQKKDLGLHRGSNSTNIADLNEPVNEVSAEEVCTSASSMLPRRDCSYIRNQDRQRGTCSNSQNIYNKYPQDIGEGCSTIFQSTSSMQKWQLLTKREKWDIDCDKKSSNQNVIHNIPEDFCELGQFIPTRSEDLSPSYLFNQTHTEKLFRERTDGYTNLAGRSHSPEKIYSATTSAQTSDCLSFLAKLEDAPRTSNLNFPWEKNVCGTSMPADVEGFTYLRGPRTGKVESGNIDPSTGMYDCLPHKRLNREIICGSNEYHDELHPRSNLSSAVKLLPDMNFEKPSFINAKCHTNLFDELDTQKSFLKGLRGSDKKVTKDFNLNQALTNGLCDGFSEQPGQKGLEANKSSPGTPSLAGICCTREPFDLNMAVETEIDSGSSAQANGTEASVPQESHENKVASPGIYMNPKQSRTLKEAPTNPGWMNALVVSNVDSTHAEQRVRANGFSTNIRFLDLEKPVSEEQAISDDDNGCMRNIDLNTEATIIDHLNPSGKESDVEAQTLLEPSVSSSTGKRISIDLDLPAETLAADDTDVADPSISKLDRSRKKDVNMSETSPITAAEIIISMSFNISGCAETSIPLPCLADSADLFWFAGIVTSSDGAFPLPVCEGENCASSDVDGMDFFEVMTLQLTESKLENLLVGAPEKEIYEEEAGKFSSLLLPKFKRGQARRRRQKRDFQKDVLPGLASLSRQEVREDLQIIDGMMRASGESWQHNATRRNNGRGGGRGRRQLNRRATTPVMVEVPVESPPKEPNSKDLETEGMSIMGWGRTRRCRRPRCPPGSITTQALT